MTKLFAVRRSPKPKFTRVRILTAIGVARDVEHGFLRPVTFAVGETVEIDSRIAAQWIKNGLAKLSTAEVRTVGESELERRSSQQALRDRQDFYRRVRLPQDAIL
jgi:hypothetical protein